MGEKTDKNKQVYPALSLSSSTQVGQELGVWERHPYLFIVGKSLSKMLPFSRGALRHFSELLA